MRFGSVCSGIEAASVAWHPLGWETAWVSEIEPFPCAVLAHRLPGVPNHGDMTLLPALIEFGAVEAPDMLVGGTPCQAFSVAGMRRSLDDARGNLSLTYCEIANAIDNARAKWGGQPAIIVWENVPGVLSTKDNAFGCFLAGLAGEDVPLESAGGKWSDAGCVLGPQRAVAWRVLDAQYFGLAQRRRRVFVVASARDGFDPAAVLLEFDGVRRDSAPSREPREGIAVGAARSPFLRCGCGYKFDVALGAYGCPNCEGDNGPATNEVASATTMAHGQGGAEIAEDRAPTLTCNHEAPIAFLPDTAHTLRAEGFDASEDGTPLVPVRGATPYDLFQVTAPINRQNRDETSPCHTLARDNAAHAAIVQPMQVRRLTPRECERLQGFPDDYTLIPWRKKPSSECPDGPRYKALGNSMAVTVMRWIGTRINTAVTAAEFG